jgi:hypothetical protein
VAIGKVDQAEVDFIATNAKNPWDRLSPVPGFVYLLVVMPLRSETQFFSAVTV